MLVQEFSHYLNLGFWYLKLLLCLSFPLIGYVILKKWEYAVAKEVEISRLMALDAAETAKAEEEDAEAGYYAAGSVSGPELGFRGEVKVEESLIGCSSASNGNGTVHCVKGDNSCQHFDVSHSQRAKNSSLFPETAGPAIDSSECSKQTLKSNLVESLSSSSHGTHFYVDNGAKIASRVTNVDVVKSNINVATSDKRYASGDQVRASKLSRHHGADQRGVKKGLLSYELYGWNKIELQPCGLVNCGNSCYANAVLQCLAFTLPLTAYFLQGLHSKSCPKKD